MTPLGEKLNLKPVVVLSMRIANLGSRGIQWGQCWQDILLPAGWPRTYYADHDRV